MTEKKKNGKKKKKNRKGFEGWRKFSSSRLTQFSSKNLPVSVLRWIIEKRRRRSRKEKKRWLYSTTLLNYKAFYSISFGKMSANIYIFNLLFSLDSSFFYFFFLSFSFSFLWFLVSLSLLYCIFLFFPDEQLYCCWLTIKRHAPWSYGVVRRSGVRHMGCESMVSRESIAVWYRESGYVNVERLAHVCIPTRTIAFALTRGHAQTRSYSHTYTLTRTYSHAHSLMHFLLASYQYAYMRLTF